MTTKTNPDITAGDPSPELTQASLIAAVQMLNKFGFNIEIPASTVTGPINVKRSLNICPTGTATPNTSYGAQLNVSNGPLRTTLLQQSVDVNDERLYLVNNASPTIGTFTGNFLYDKINAAASYYIQVGGVHTFAVAPIASAANAPVTWTNIVSIGSGGLSLVGNLSVAKNIAGNTFLAQFTDNANSSNFTIDSVGAINAYIQGSAVGDSALRAELGNLVLGAQTGATTIGTSTKTIARFNTDGTVVIPGTAGVQSTYGGVSIGSGVTLTVGAGTDSASQFKGFWMYNNIATLNYYGGGMQLNANNGVDMWVGDQSANWLRALTFHKSAKALFGGVNGATPIGDVHINQNNADISGSLSLTGLAAPSYILMGNRDSSGTAGPAMIAASNRQLKFGVGDSYTSRNGGTFTATMTVDGPSGSVLIGNIAAALYQPLVVDLTNGSTFTQVASMVKSPSGVVSGGLGAGNGFAYGNNIFVGQRIVYGADANNAGLSISVAQAGGSVEGIRVDSSKNLTVRGDAINLGAATVSVMGCNASSDTYVRGATINFQNAAANVTWLSITPTLITAQIDQTFNGNVTVGQVLSVNRVVEGMVERTSTNGVTVFDYNSSQQFYTSVTANFVPNFTNIPTTVDRIITLTILVTQGATGYIPTGVQINGAAATVKWAGGVVPIATANNIDVFQFSLIRLASNTWIVLGSATPYV